MSVRARGTDPLGAAIFVDVPADAATRLAPILSGRSLRPQPARPEDVARVVETAPAVVVIAGPGGDALPAALRAAEDLPVIAVLASASDEGVEEALRAGAIAAITAASSQEELALALDRALAAPATPDADEPPAPPARRSTLLGASEPMRRVAELISRAAALPATALVRGETGTGKELVARSLHELGPRRDRPFVKVHCAALPDALLESELFGYEKGAFTGATARKPGRVELAEGGTLFLDEIGDISPATQVKLLRLLQDREYERLGGVATLRADVRFVTATHRDLEGMVKAGTFREDLFYRLNVVTIWLPPLRARREDVQLLAEQFCREFAAAYGKPHVTLTPDAVQVLRSQRWPGNVRQLQNFLERLVVLAGDTITAADVRAEMSDQVRFKTQLTANGPLSSLRGAAQVQAQAEASSLADALKIAERQAIERALRQVNGNRTAAARVLGVSRATLYTKLEEHGIGSGG